MSDTNPLPAQTLLALADRMAECICVFYSTIQAVEARDAYRAARAASQVTLEDSEDPEDVAFAEWLAKNETRLAHSMQDDVQCMRSAFYGGCAHARALAEAKGGGSDA